MGGLIHFPSIYKRENRIVFIDGTHDIPIEIKRVFYIYGEIGDGTVRGKHANRESEFVLFCIKGTCSVKVIGIDYSETVYELNKPDMGLFLPKMTWKEMYGFSSDCVLMVITNKYYSPVEYIRDFDSFRAEMKG